MEHPYMLRKVSTKPGQAQLTTFVVAGRFTPSLRRRTSSSHALRWRNKEARRMTSENRNLHPEEHIMRSVSLFALEASFLSPEIKDSFQSNDIIIRRHVLHKDRGTCSSVNIVSKFQVRIALSHALGNQLIRD